MGCQPPPNNEKNVNNHARNVTCSFTLRNPKQLGIQIFNIALAGSPYVVVVIPLAQSRIVTHGRNSLSHRSNSGFTVGKMRIIA